MGKFNTMLYFSISSLVILLIITFVYFGKKKIKNIETKFYSSLIIVTILSLVLEIVSGLLLDTKMLEIRFVIKKLFMITILVWESIVLLYSLYITLEDKGKKYNVKESHIIISVLIIFLFIASCFVLGGDLKANMDSNGMIINTYGLSQSIFSMTAVFLIIIILGILVSNIKKLKSKKYTPIIFFLFSIIIVGWLQIIFPNFLMINYVLSITVVLMYFTIENPDLKLLRELHNAKEKSDNANEEKTLFLYNITQEIRNTASNINTEADEILESESLLKDKDNARNIKTETSKFNTMLNDIYDVSMLDSSNIKIYNNHYDFKVILKSIVSNYNNICKNKSISFRTNIEHNIPDRMYGDAINLKKIINLLLSYSAKSTKEGFIELDINTIIKNDLCRLIISIEDSSIGIKSDDFEKIKNSNVSLSEAYKTTILLGGTMMMSSEYGHGTKYKIVLDQKIDTSEDKEHEKYEKIYDNKKILVVDDSEASIKIIEKLLKDSNVVIDSVNNGRDAINKIKTKNRYDLILLDEELNQISGEYLLGRLQKFRNFDIPVILMSKDNKYEYNEEYKEIGFKDIIIKPIKKEILIEKINKYCQNEDKDNL